MRAARREDACGSAVHALGREDVPVEVHADREGECDAIHPACEGPRCVNQLGLEAIGTEHRPGAALRAIRLQHPGSQEPLRV